MKILRANIDGIEIYMADDKGKANMSEINWLEYVQALDKVALFEQEVDRQYEKS